jgi:hypothetical protein
MEMRVAGADGDFNPGGRCCGTGIRRDVPLENAGAGCMDVKRYAVHRSARRAQFRGRAPKSGASVLKNNHIGGSQRG